MTCRSGNASSLHNPTEYVAQTALGYLEGGLLLLVLNVDAGPVFHQQLGCFYALLVTRQVAGKKKKKKQKTCRIINTKMLFFFFLVLHVVKTTN